MLWALRLPDCFELRSGRIYLYLHCWRRSRQRTKTNCALAFSKIASDRDSFITDVSAQKLFLWSVSLIFVLVSLGSKAVAYKCNSDLFLGHVLKPEMKGQCFLEDSRMKLPDIYSEFAKGDFLIDCLDWTRVEDNLRKCFCCFRLLCSVAVAALFWWSSEIEKTSWMFEESF